MKNFDLAMKVIGYGFTGAFLATILFCSLEMFLKEMKRQIYLRKDKLRRLDGKGYYKCGKN